MDTLNNEHFSLNLQNLWIKGKNWHKTTALFFQAMRNQAYDLNICYTGVES